VLRSPPEALAKAGVSKHEATPSFEAGAPRPPEDEADDTL